MDTERAAVHNGPREARRSRRKARAAGFLRLEAGCPRQAAAANRLEGTRAGAVSCALTE